MSGAYSEDYGLTTDEAQARTLGLLRRIKSDFEALKARLDSIEKGGDAIMSTKEAAAYLGLAEQTLATRRSKGLPPDYVQFIPRGSVSYLKAELDRWIEANGRKTHSVEEMTNVR